MKIIGSTMLEVRPLGLTERKRMGLDSMPSNCMPRTRVMPNTEGVFLITFPNASDNEYILPSRTVVG